jgi:hypothetical protein
MKKLILTLTMCCLLLVAIGQKAKNKKSVSNEVKIAMTASQWDYPANTVEFINYKNVASAKILGTKMTLKDFQFSDGTIEFDIEPQEEPFAGIFFRMANHDESEYFYLRIGLAGNPTAMDAVQYAPLIKGINLWDMLDHYQGPANFTKNEWNHVKMVISGKQMLVYLNDMNRATLEIPRLEGNTTTGTIAFNGRCVIGNLVVKHNEVEGLSSREGFDPTHHDPRYIRSWQVNEPQPLPRGHELYDGNIPKLAVPWKVIDAERRGLINLTRLYGGGGDRRYVWLRAKLISATEQKRKISLGFSDEVWVFLNRQPVFVDKNLYTSAHMKKDPDGRISIENAQFEMTLKAGENTLLIGVANDFFGWGLIARLDKMDGIQVSTDFPPPVLPPSDLSIYTGTYKTTDGGDLELAFTVENNALLVKPSGQSAIELEYFEKDKFRIEAYDVVLEFFAAEKKLILKQGGKTTTFVKQ